MLSTLALKLHAHFSFAVECVEQSMGLSTHNGQVKEICFSKL